MSGVDAGVGDADGAVGPAAVAALPHLLCLLDTERGVIRVEPLVGCCGAGGSEAECRPPGDGTGRLHETATLQVVPAFVGWLFRHVTYTTLPTGTKNGF